MLYIQQSLNPNEEIISIGQFHWMYTFMASISLILGLFGFITILYIGLYWEVLTLVKQYNPKAMPFNLGEPGIWDAAIQQLGGFLNAIKSIPIGFKLGSFAILILGILGFVQKMIIKATTEICLTTDRLVLKRGMVARHVAEISVDRIEGVEVMQGILGRILGYGRVIVRGMGVGEIFLPPIAEPIIFRKSIERARSIKKEDSV